jgi:CheY-like chemotaxis protein
VADTGVGMASDVLDHIFEPFFTTKELGEGTGLGLATAYGIVAQSGGHIDVASQLGQGTRFDLFFPAAEGAPQSLRPASVSPGTLQGHETVLVCEDEPVVRRMLVRTLRRAGYTVWEAKGGAQALRLVQEHRPTVDLLLTDVVMPEMNGHQLASALQRVYPGLKTLYCSGYAADVFADQEELPPDSALLSKPFKTETLLGRVRDALERKR